MSDFTLTFHFHALEKAMATHSSVLAWRIPGTGEPGGLLPMGSHGVGHNWSDLAAAAALLFLNILFYCCWIEFFFPYIKYVDCLFTTLHACMLSRFSHVWLFATLRTVASQALLSLGFSRQEYRSGLPCPPPGDLPNPVTEPKSPMSPALAGGFFITRATWEVHLPPY